MRTIVDDIVNGAHGGGSLTIIGADGRPARWADVHERARRMAGVLAGHGVKRGSRVGLLGDTGLGLVTALQAVWLAGGAITMSPPPPPSRGRPDTVLRIIKDGRLDLVVTDAILPGVPHAVHLADLESASLAAGPAVIVEPDPTDLAILQYTSGSTSEPRGVPVSHGHLMANIEGIRAALHHDSWHGTPLMSWLPLFHDMGLIGFLAFPMSCGCPLVLQSPLAFARRPASWLEALQRHRIAVTGAPNFAYQLMVSLLRAGLDVDLGSVRLMLCGGEPIDPAVMAAFAAAASRNGLRPNTVVPAYGLAEATLAVSLAPAGVATDVVDGAALERDGLAVPTATGKALVRLGPPVSGTAIRITDPDTGEVFGGRRVGRIEVRGPSVAGCAPGGWLSTGDLGYLADGELVVCGREKDVLFAGGRNVYPQDIEAVAGRVPGVRTGSPVAFGVPGDHGDRLIVAIEVVAVEAAGAEPSRVRSAVAAAVVGQTGLRPAEVVTMPAGRSPKTSSGKPRRAEARRRYLCDELTLKKGPTR